MDCIEIEIVNWGKHQRKDVKRPSWFALDNRIFEDAKLFDLSDAEWKAFLYILCQASQNNSSKVNLSTRHAERICGIPKKVLESTISRLCDVGVTRTSRGRHAHVTPQDKTRQDRQDKQDKTILLAPVSKKPDTNPVGLYCDLWKAKNGKSPDIRPKEAGQLHGLVKDVGWQRAQEIIRTYFAMPDPFFIRRGYDVGTMLLSLNAIAQFESNGKIVTKAVVEGIEKQVDKVQGTKKRRSLEEVEAEREAYMAEAEQKKLGGTNAN